MIDVFYFELGGIDSIWVVYGGHSSPSACIWMVPGTQTED